MSAFQLRPWDHRRLLNLLDHPHDAKQLRRAQALLWLHEGQPVLRVAELLRVEPRTVYNWTYAFRERTDLGPSARLLDAPRSGRPPTALGIIDPLIDAVIEDDPRTYGYRSTVWMAPLLQRYLGEVHPRRAGDASPSVHSRGCDRAQGSMDGTWGQACPGPLPLTLKPITQSTPGAGLARPPRGALK